MKTKNVYASWIFFFSRWKPERNHFWRFEVLYYELRSTLKTLHKFHLHVFSMYSKTKQRNFPSFQWWQYSCVAFWEVLVTFGVWTNDHSTVQVQKMGQSLAQQFCCKIIPLNQLPNSYWNKFNNVFGKNPYFTFECRWNCLKIKL